MENLVFPYDSKWEEVQFKPASKPIVTFQDVTEYQQRPIHEEYLNFLTDLQRVNMPPCRPSPPRRSPIPWKHPSLPSSSPSSRNCSNFCSRLRPSSSL